MSGPQAPSSTRIDLLTVLRELPDPRVERTRLHNFEDILLISICSLLCGAESFEDMELFGEAREPWLRTFLELPHGIPSHDTFNRIFAALDPQRFLEAFMRWTQSLRTALAGEVAAIAGLQNHAKARGYILEPLEWGQCLPDMRRPRQVIFDQLRPRTWDLFVGILWCRFGSPSGAKKPGTDEGYGSGTYEEFRIAYDLWQTHRRPRIRMFRGLHDPDMKRLDGQQ